MISVEEARLILEDSQTDDKDIQETIHAMQLLVELMFDTWHKEQKNDKKIRQ
ncbi:MAG: hypothetical protein Q8P21_01810 [bacterium]|nr:hypothetical protein [bacterium]